MILGFLLTALYWPGIAGAATTPRWALLAIALPFLNWRACPAKLTAIHLFGSGFLAWAAITLIWTPNWRDGTGELLKLLILTQAFLLGSRSQNLGPILRGMALGLVGSSIVLLIQRWYPEIVLHTTTNSGLFINSGSLAEIAALVLIGLAGDIAASDRYSHRWNMVLAAGLLACIILPASRGALLAVIAAAAAWIWRESKRSALVVIGLGCAAFAASLYSGFHVASVMQRLGMWSDAISGLSWLGHGVGSFWTDYAALATTVDTFVERPEHLHNDWLEIVFELGPLGLSFVGLAIHSAVRSQCDLGSKLVLAGVVAEASVGFPLHSPCTGFVAVLCLGHLARGRPSVRNVLDAGRDRLRQWSGRQSLARCEG